MQTDDKAAAVPEVSVVLAVRNGMPYVEQAMRSMMVQTLRNIEIIVVDDASTDETAAVLARLAAEDARIRILTLAQNVGLASALNHGLALAQAPYIARMDADDISSPERLDIQKRFMDAHPEVVLSGTNCRYIDARGQVLKVPIRPRDSLMCRWLMRFRLPLIHPTFIFRNLSVDGAKLFYDPAYPVGQDHDFAIRILQRGNIVCIPNVLLDYRLHPGSVTSSKWTLQQSMSRKAVSGLIEADLPPAVVKGIGPFLTTFFQQTKPDPRDFFGGLRAMLAHDSARHPAHARWFRRQTAQLAWDALKRARLSKPKLAWTSCVMDLISWCRFCCG